MKVVSQLCSTCGDDTHPLNAVFLILPDPRTYSKEHINGELQCNITGLAWFGLSICNDCFSYAAQGSKSFWVNQEVLGKGTPDLRHEFNSDRRTFNGKLNIHF